MRSFEITSTTITALITIAPKTEYQTLSNYILYKTKVIYSYKTVVPHTLAESNSTKVVLFIFSVTPVMSEKKGKTHFNSSAFATQNSKDIKVQHLLKSCKFSYNFFL